MPEFTIDLGLRILGAFLLGSIPFAIISMWGSGVDIRTVGSGNPGFNNVLRVSKPRSIILEIQHPTACVAEDRCACVELDHHLRCD